LRQAFGPAEPQVGGNVCASFIADYSNREIAGIMKTSSAVVAVVLHRTRAQLKKDFNALTRGIR